MGIGEHDRGKLDFPATLDNLNKYAQKAAEIGKVVTFLWKKGKRDRAQNTEKNKRGEKERKKIVRRKANRKRKI